MQRRWLQSNKARFIFQYLLLPFILYSAVMVFVTWPLATQLSTHAAGPEYADSLEYLRLGWWGKYALQNGLNPFYQSLFGYPEGFFSATQSAQPLIYWPITLLGFVFNPTAAFNLWLLLEVILSGLTAYWLCRDVLRESNRSSIIAALIGGLIFMIYPAVQGHLFAGHVNPLSNYAFPIVLICMLRIIEKRGSWRTALVGAIALLILALGNFTFPAYLLLPTALFIGGYLLLFRRYLFTAVVLRNLAIMFVAGALLTLPFYIPLAKDITAVNRLSYLQESGWVKFSTDPMAFVSLSSMTSWLEPITSNFSRHVLTPNAVEGSAYLGITAVGLAIIAVTRRRRESAIWLVLAIGCMVFSLGPILKWNGRAVSYRLGDGDEVKSNIVLPYALFQSLPIVNVTRTPGRFNMTTGLALGVLAAIGLHYVLNAMKSRERQIILAVLIGLFIIAEYQVSFPFQTSRVAIPDYFYKLAAQSDNNLAVLELPFSDPINQKRALLNQTVHHKPLIAGYVSRTTPVDPSRLTFLSDVAFGKVFTAMMDIPEPDMVRALLHDYGVGVVVYYWVTVKNKDEVVNWATQNFGNPVHDDPSMSVFEVPQPQTEVDTTAIVFSDDGWWVSSQGETAADTVHWMTGDDASTLIYSPKEQDQHIMLPISPLLQSRRLEISLDREFVNSQQIDSAPVDLRLHLTQGIHTLQFIQPEGCTPVPVAPACLLNGNVNGDSCKLPGIDKHLCVSMALNTVRVGQAEPEFKPTNVRLSGAGNDVYLKASYLPSTITRGASFRVQTTWQSTGLFTGDYHFFVHVLDAAGKLVAQYDSIPGDGKYPTMQWTASQTWIESVWLTIPKELPEGHYGVYTGWYSYPDLVRLKVESDAPHAHDGLVYLGDVEAK